MFPAFRYERVLHDDEDLLVVDKPPGFVVHGGDESLGGDVVTRLATLLESRGDDPYLGVHQRLDVGTSGVLVFTRRPALNAQIAAEFSKHSVERVYVAALELGAKSALSEHGVLEHQLLTSKGRSEIVRRGGQHVKTRYRMLERVGQRALIELRPETGRTHQLRVQLAHVGASIAGDTLYGGAPAYRLMLHARETAFAARSARFVARVPSDFSDWVHGRPLSLGTPERMRAALLDAAALRSPLLRSTDTFRVVNTSGDGLPDVVIDRYGEFCVLSLSSAEAFERRQEIAELLVEHGVRGVYLKVRARTDLRRAKVEELAPAEPVLGEAAPATFNVRERTLNIEVELGQGLSTGLFVDQRDNRARIQALSANARVLNLFCYTGSFSVAAAVGGAQHVTSVDLSKRALERAKHNFRINDLDPQAHAFIATDAIEWLARAQSRKLRFELIVLDPPSFSSIGKKTFSVQAAYAEVAARALSVLSPRGRLLAVTNHRKTTLGGFRAMLRDAAKRAQREIVQLKDLPSGLDCPPAPDGSEPSKSVLVTVS